MNKAEELILQMEMNEYLKVAVQRIIEETKVAFPNLPGLTVSINVYISPPNPKEIKIKRHPFNRDTTNN